MISKKIYIAGISFLLSLNIMAQRGDIDSLKALLAPNIPDTTRAEVANQLAKQFLFKDQKESLKYSYLAYETALKTKDPIATNEALLYIGNVYSTADIHLTALYYYKTVLKNLKECHCLSLEAKANMYAGETVNYMKEYDSALVYLYRADSLYKINNNTKYRHINYLFISQAEMNLGHTAHAMSFIRKSLDHFSRTGDTTALLNAMLVQAACYDKRGDYKRELDVLLKMRTLYNKTGMYPSLCAIESKLADVYMKKNLPRKAYEHLKTSLACLKKHNDPKVMKHNLEQLSNYFAKIGNYNKAIEYNQKYKDFSDSLETVHLNNIKDLSRIRYDMETKLKSLELLKRDNSIRDLIYKKNIFYKNLSRILLIFFFLIFLILFHVFWVRRKAHKKLVETNRKLEEIHKELEIRRQQQQQENQIRNKLFMILAHDLINPFNALLGFAELLSEEIQNFERRDIKRHSEFIFQASKQLHFLLENLLHWARIQTNRVQLQPTYFELNKTIRDTAEVYRYMAEKKKITFQINTQDDLIVYADESLITVVLNNLIHNAVKYTDELGIVTVEGYREKDRITVSVRDTGDGITPEEQEKLFNLEYHFTRKGTSGEEGTGLGLIICKEFLSLHSATLTVESTPGEGSRLSFSLPVKKQ